MCELGVLPPLPPKLWDYKPEVPCLALISVSVVNMVLEPNSLSHLETSGDGRRVPAETRASTLSVVLCVFNKLLVLDFVIARTYLIP